MLISIKMNNMFIYNSETDFSLVADMRSKRFKSNLLQISDEYVVKSAVVMGPNNVGKTNLIKCINAIKRIILNERPYYLERNMFSNDPLSSFELVFGYDNKVYKLKIKYDTKNDRLSSEEYSILTKRSTKETIIMSRGGDNKAGTVFLNTQFFKRDTDKLSAALALSSYGCLMIHLIDEQQAAIMSEIKRPFISFAQSIEIIDMNHLSIQKTIEMMKKSETKQNKISEFIRCADLYLDDIVFLSDEQVKISVDTPDDSIIQNRMPSELPASINEQLHLCSIYKGNYVPSVLFDSEGTKKMTAISSYVIDALKNGKVLVVDELDSSLHFKLLRAIISLFNNELNNTAQLIATVHDISLLDCKRLFRKEQIWFAHKDVEGVYLYSLAEFTSDDYGVRETSDLVEKYKQGVFGALPYPDLFDVLTDEEFEKESNERKEDIDFLSLIDDEGDESDVQ